VPQSPDTAIPGIEVFALLANGPLLLGPIKLRFDTRDDPLGYIVLQIEYVTQITVVALGPYVMAGDSID
jgi:hypothetical protein